MRAMQVAWFGEGFVNIDYNALNNALRKQSKARKRKIKIPDSEFIDPRYLGVSKSKNRRIL